MKKTFIDLFSGAGGMSCGLEMAGWACLLGIDHDRAAIETFQHNHPQAQAIAGDIREISNQQIQAIIDLWRSTLSRLFDNWTKRSSRRT
jgi:DNA (cytosine-5)-methyltransferase 1